MSTNSPVVRKEGYRSYTPSPPIPDSRLDTHLDDEKIQENQNESDISCDVSQGLKENSPTPIQVAQLSLFKNNIFKDTYSVEKLNISK